MYIETAIAKYTLIYSMLAKAVVVIVVPSVLVISKRVRVIVAE